MHRRTIFKAGAFLPIAGMTSVSSTFAQATPEASPIVHNDPSDTTARELIDRLASIPPLALLEALETADVTEPMLLEASGGKPIVSTPWTDIMDTDLEHSLGGVILQFDGRDLHDPESKPIGGYVVFESAEIAYDQLMRSLGPDPNYASGYAAGTKAWLLPEDGEAESESGGLGIMRLGYVIAMATEGHLAEGIVRHLDTVSLTLS